MRILILVQDLRTSGTSEGVVSRSFIFRMRQVYPESFIRVIYFKHSDTFDEIDQLPINEIKVVKINAIYPSHILWLNKF